MPKDEIKEVGLFEEFDKLSVQEVQKVRSVLESFPVHNHDGRNSQKVATKKVKSSIKTEEVRPNTTAIAGEDLSNGNGVRIGIDGNTDDKRAEITQLEKGNNGAKVIQWDDSPPYPRRGAQSFILRGGLPEKLKSITVQFGGSGTSWTAICELTENNNGIPGTVLGTSAEIDPVGLATDIEFVFATPIDIQPDTIYWWQVRANGELLGSPDAVFLRSSVGDVYDGGTGKQKDGVWTDLGRDHYFKLNFTDTASRIYKSNASTSELAGRTIGVSNKNVLKGQTPEIISYGNKGDFSNLTEGGAYYITDTRGSLTTSPGTVERQIGLAMSSSNLFITL